MDMDTQLFTRQRDVTGSFYQFRVRLSKFWISDPGMPLPHTCYPNLQPL